MAVRLPTSMPDLAHLRKVSPALCANSDVTYPLFLERYTCTAPVATAKASITRLTPQAQKNV